MTTQPLDLPEGYCQPGEVFQAVKTILDKDTARDDTKLDAAKILFDEIRYQSQPTEYKKGVEHLKGILFTTKD